MPGESYRVWFKYLLFGVHVTFSERSIRWLGLKEANKMGQLNWNTDSR